MEAAEQGERAHAVRGLGVAEDAADSVLADAAVIAGKTTPKAAANALQKDWDKFHKTLR